jgi:hypothetical protein
MTCVQSDEQQQQNNALGSMISMWRATPEEHAVLVAGIKFQKNVKTSLVAVGNIMI